MVRDCSSAVAVVMGVRGSVFAAATAADATYIIVVVVRRPIATPF